MGHHSVMPQAIFSVHGSLNHFIAAPWRGRPIVRWFEASPGIEDALQAMGVPHPEVDRIVVNDRPVGFDYRLRPGDRVEVFGLDGRSEAPDALRLIPDPPDPPRFVLDGHLGRLARYLRMLGFDSSYQAQATDPELAATSASEERILLTRDRGLLKRSIVRHAYLIRDDDPRRQLAEVVSRYRLAAGAAPFTRCVRCNATIEPVNRSDVAQALAGEPRTLRYFVTFGRCVGCGAIYWPGSHFDRMTALAQEVLRAEPIIGENQPEEPRRRSVE
jgi:uncharacterized protein with PIN domain